MADPAVSSPPVGHGTHTPSCMRNLAQISTGGTLQSPTPVPEEPPGRVCSVLRPLPGRQALGAAPRAFRLVLRLLLDLSDGEFHPTCLVIVVQDIRVGGPASLLPTPNAPPTPHSQTNHQKCAPEPPLGLGHPPWCLGRLQRSSPGMWEVIHHRSNPAGGEGQGKMHEALRPGPGDQGEASAHCTRAQGGPQGLGWATGA